MPTWRRPKTPSRPPVCFTESKHGCPFDCGLCPDHGQHSCSALLEITQRCNLHCPVCFADSGDTGTADPDLETIESWYRSVRHACGDHIAVQLSGGEPTVRQDLPEIIAAGRRHGFSFLQLNTNGLRVAKDPNYARQLKEAGLATMFLQFDGTDDTIYRKLRGRDLLEIKLRAIDHAVAARLGVVLVPTIVPRVNTQNIGDILRFGLERSPGVRGVHFQPISYFGRFPYPPRMKTALRCRKFCRPLSASQAATCASIILPRPAVSIPCVLFTATSCHCRTADCTRLQTHLQAAAASQSWRQKVPGNQRLFLPDSGPRPNPPQSRRKKPEQKPAVASRQHPTWTIFCKGSKPIPSPFRQWLFRTPGTLTLSAPAIAVFMWSRPMVASSLSACIT
nr:radical SAM protein [Syntrophotalea acetylenica]